MTSACAIAFAPGSTSPSSIAHSDQRIQAPENESSPMTAARKEDKLVNYLCMTGHICSDINQGALSATLPFLVMYDGYSYTAVAGLIFVANIASAVIQPLFGTIGDRKSTRLNSSH